MIGTAVKILVGWGVPAKAAKPVLFGGLALLAVAAWSLWLWQHDEGVRAEHDTQVNLQSEKQAREADTANAEQARADDARNTSEGTELGKVQANDPESNRSLTDSERAYLRCVRLQQYARSRGEPAPAC